MVRSSWHRAAASFISLFAGAALALLTGICFAEAQSKQVLIVHSFGRNFLPWVDYATAIRTELERQARSPISIQDYPLFTTASADENPEPAFVEYLRALYRRQPPDLVLTIGAPAARFVQRQRATLFPTTPALFAVVDKRFVDSAALTEFDTTVSASIDLLPLFENILQLLPNTKEIAVMIGTSPPEQGWLSELQKALKVLEGRVVVKYHNDRTFDEMLKIAAALPPDSAIFWPQLRVDAAGVVHEGRGPLQRMYAVANAPIFSYDEVFFHGETVGGPMTPTTELARKTADAAAQLLAGRPAASFNIEPTGLAPPRYDWRQLQRWQISESRLPLGSEISFREMTLLQKYWWQSAAVVAVLLLQAALIARLLYERSSRQRIEAELRQRMSELAHINRYSTAGELCSSITHELNQPLGSILGNAEAAALMLNAKSPDLNEMKQIIEDIRRDDNRASEIIRRLRGLLKMQPLEFRIVDLNDAVREVLEILSGLSHERHVSLTSSLALVRLPIRGDPVQIQQVVMNLIVNAIDAVSQSGPGLKKVIVRTAQTNGHAEASVGDTGPGIPPHKIDQVFDPFFTTKEAGMGMGLSIARTIMRAHGGTIWAENNVEGGAVFRIRLPLHVAGHR